MTDLRQRLLDLAESLEGCEWNHPITAVETCRAAAEIVARLPMTADGVPVVPGMDVWFSEPSPHCALAYQARMDGEIATTFHGSVYKSVAASDVYSTREAAEKARDQRAEAEQ